MKSCSLFVRFGMALSLGAIGCSSVARAGVSYNDPAGGWRYIYQGILNPGVEGLPAGYGFGDDTQGLDGKWEHGQSDKWDGTGPGNPVIGNPGNAPGGVAALTDGATSYIRVQDAGNPELHGWQQGATDPQNTNRRVYFGHDMQQDFTSQDPLPDQRVLQGITVSFRARIPNTGVLDDFYTTDPANGNAPIVRPWIDPQTNPSGRGSLMTNGRGAFNIVQNVPFPNGDDSDNLIGFSLVTSTDISTYVAGGGTGSITTSPGGTGGLIMNNLVGGAPSGLIDSLSSGTLNMLPITDPSLNQWHEFWITITNAGGSPGTHKVDVYMDGSLTATTFKVTSASTNNAAYANSNSPYLEFGFSDSDRAGALDIDFFSYKLGVIAPTATPVEDADFDNNNIVDGADFLIWQRGFGKSPGALPSEGDANGDFAVNTTDFNLWKAKFGGPPALAAAGGVPEPTGILMLLTAAMLAAGAQRRRRAA